MNVSVVVPVFNGEKTIKQCIESLLQQKFSGSYEIITVDDGSRDRTAEIVKRFAKVKYVFQENAGPAKARNNGAKNAQGEIILFIDSDCVAKSNSLKETK